MKSVKLTAEEIQFIMPFVKRGIRILKINLSQKTYHYDDDPRHMQDRKEMLEKLRDKLDEALPDIGMF